MALRRPPQHRVDAPILFVHRSDDAWDLERFREEQARMRAAELDPFQHPLARYMGGWTRYDLDAQATVEGKVVSPRDYLDLAKAPTIWKLRRLDIHEWYEIQPMVEAAHLRGHKPYDAYKRAARIGIVRVDNGPTLEIAHGRLTEADLGKLYEIDADLCFDLGEAVYQASLKLTDVEKKVSA